MYGLGVVGVVVVWGGGGGGGGGVPKDCPFSVKDASA